MSRRPPGRNDAHRVAALGVGHEKKRPVGRAAQENEPLLAIDFTVVDDGDRKRVLESEFRALEGDTMLARIGAGLGVIPLELTLAQLTTGIQ